MPVYSALDVAEQQDYGAEFPGVYPYTRWACRGRGRRAGVETAAASGTFPRLRIEGCGLEQQGGLVQSTCRVCPYTLCAMSGRCVGGSLQTVPSCRRCLPLPPPAVQGPLRFHVHGPSVDNPAVRRVLHRRRKQRVFQGEKND